MESNERPDPVAAAAALDDLHRSQARLAAGLRLPSGFYLTIGLAISATIFLFARGLAAGSEQVPLLLLAGLAVFAVVAGIQVLRFRRLNGALVWSLVSQVVLGKAALSSLAYAAALAGAVWAGYAGNWWLTALCAAAGGAGYVAGGMRWMRQYRAEPQLNGGGGEMAWWVAAVCALVVAGVVLLVGSR
ncbi:hypothetical protein ACFCV3_29085 [Kribbella sp. NPDC056345]|uniref:hypothetical protein n=1 Tax=Kribbella sp. NPDC056345 TaxID=3345789 RepID=UPI0035D6CDB2